MLSQNSLPMATQRVFEHFAQNTRLADFTLIGGSALALQAAHRYSEDLDFWLPARQLDKSRIYRSHAPRGNDRSKTYMLFSRPKSTNTSSPWPKRR
ncbi:MAG: hypothetical protein EPN21_15200 [Methylococcaceae bacterium]|nr:MAG: hypothetical protein EPN21_15200 [Methylococcaceae bacterium]